MSVVGQNIRKYRKQRKMSPEQFAVALGCTVQQVFNYEGGRTRITEETIKDAAGILGVSVQSLFKEC